MRASGTLCFLLGLCLHTGIALAEDAPPDGYRDVVRNALIEVREKNWPEAKALFERAHAMYPNARTLRGLGIVAFSDRSYLDAIGYLTAAMEHPVRPLTDTQHTQAEDMLERSRAFIGYLRLDLMPEASDFLIDGEAPELEPDADRVPLDPGDHQLVVRAQGRREAVRRFQIEGGKTVTLTIRLERLDGSQPVASAGPTPAKTTASAPGPEDGQASQLWHMPGLWTWVATGSAVVFGAAAAVTYGSAVSEAGELERTCRDMPGDGCDPKTRKSLIADSSISTKETLATVGLTLSVLSAAGAVVLYVAEGEGGEQDGLALHAAPGGLSLSGRF